MVSKKLLISLFVLLAIIDCGRGWWHIHQLKIQEMNMDKALRKHSQSLRKDRLNYKKTLGSHRDKSLEQMVMLANEVNVEVKLIKFLSERQGIIQLKLSGMYPDLLSFFQKLINESYILVHLAMHKKSMQELEVLLSVEPVNFLKSTIVLTSQKIHDPFYGFLDIYTHSFSLLPKEANAISINELRWAGSIVVENRRSAIVKLPNLSLVVVRVGDVLGKEHARIDRITEHAIILRVNHEKKIIQ